jgi:hypothetical protein
MKSLKPLLTISIFLIAIISKGQTIEGYSFEKYKIEKHSVTKKAKINFSSNPTAKTFRTRISEGYKSGNVDFGGYYITIIWGCGAGCISGSMVDIRDGKVYDLPLGEETAYANCYSGTDDNGTVTYKPYSRLFITTTCSEAEIENSKNNKQEKVYFINVWNEAKKKFILEKRIEKSLTKERKE